VRFSFQRGIERTDSQLQQKNIPGRCGLFGAGAAGRVRASDRATLAEGPGCFTFRVFQNKTKPGIFLWISLEVFEKFQEKSEEKGMRNQTYLFVVFCLILTTGLLEVNHLAHEYFSPVKDQNARIAELEARLERQKLQVALLKNQIVDETQQVAWAVPALDQMKKDAGTYSLRTIASVSQAAVTPLDLSKPLLEQAKADFRKGDYQKSADGFQQLIDKYPTSPLLVESYFFQAESYFMSRRYQECLDVIDHMITQYPDHELTGYILLRQGQILEARHRDQEAGEVFRLVMSKFSYNHELSAQAKKLLDTTAE
jgi:TolA-binding protein